jgi:chemotaxis protein histidine kinase CheA
MLPRGGARPSPLPVGSVAVLELAGVRFALPAATILEVAIIPSYIPLPCQDPRHLGVVLHREKIVPLVDVGAALGAGGPRRPIPGLCVVARAAAGAVAFPVDRVLGVEPLGADSRLDRLPCPGGITVLRRERWAERHGHQPAAD